MAETRLLDDPKHWHGVRTAAGICHAGSENEECCGHCCEKPLNAHFGSPCVAAHLLM